MSDEGSDVDPTLALALRKAQRPIYPDQVTRRDPEGHIIEEWSYSDSEGPGIQLQLDATVANDVIMFYRTGVILKDLKERVGVTRQWLSTRLKEFENARRRFTSEGEWEGSNDLKELFPPYPMDIAHIASDALFSMGHSVEMEPEIDSLRELLDRIEERRIQQEKDSFMILMIHRRRRYGAEGYPEPLEQIYQDLGRRVKAARKV